MHGAPRVYALHYPTGLPVDRSAAQWGMGQAAIKRRPVRAEQMHHVCKAVRHPVVASRHPMHRVLPYFRRGSTASKVISQFVQYPCDDGFVSYKQSALL